MSPTRVFALTLWRPWSCAIVHGSKRIENRAWRPSFAQTHGQLLAIHAGGKWDEEAAEYVARLHPELAGTTAWTARGIVAVARLAEVRPARLPHERPEADPASRWEFGPWCWCLENVLALEQPVPALGRQGLWVPPPDVAGALLTAWRRRFDPRA